MIAIDWGTTSLRAFRLDADGAVRETRRSDEGVLAATGRFESVLRRAIDGWDDALIVMSGMIGGRQGWREVPYVECPAGLDEIARAMVPLDAPELADRNVWLVPGVSVRNDRSRDVMRGEETQIGGLLDSLSSGRHFVCLPGTHSKHVEVENGRIERFHTAMTGELFDVLCRHSILGRLMQLPAPHDPAAFAPGVDDASKPGDLLAHLFSVRTKGLFADLEPAALPAYLSGLLIGHELNDLPDRIESLHLVAGNHLLDVYDRALRQRGFKPHSHPDVLAARGLFALAERRNLR